MKNVFTSLVVGLMLVGCSEKEAILIRGEAGARGESGTSGQNGYSIVANTVSNPEICGDAGGTTVYLALDLDRNFEFGESDEIQTQYVTCNGKAGTNGVDGRNGLNGTSCSVNKVGNAATITCGTSTAVVVDGSKGDKGDVGQTGATGASGQNASGIYISEIINPCGVEFANDEVFLKLSTGRILALYDGGANEDRLALIAPGNYITTDRVQNRACSFTVTNDYQVINQQVQNPGNK